MRLTSPLPALLVVLALGVASAARAQFVVPSSYSYGVAPSTTGPSGPTNIYPDSGGELTDGLLGQSWSHYANELEAVVWTGWANVTPSISFRFPSSQTFSRIEIGTVRENGAAIGALTSVTIAGTTFTSGVALTDGTRDWLVFDQSFSATLVGLDPTLTISLTTTMPSQWIMIDEVRFTAIPEPAESALLVSLLTISAPVVTKKANRRRVNFA